MQERQVTIGRETHPLPDPFLVMATQNPIESDGTYPLPEAQVDRFMLKVLVDYPSATEEFVIVERMIAGLETLQRGDGRRAAARAAEGGPDRVRRPGPDRVRRSRSPPRPATRRRSASRTSRATSPSASAPEPRSIWCSRLRRSRWCAGASTCCRKTSRTIAPDVLRHRLVLSYEALGDDIDAQQIIDADPERRSRSPRSCSGP